MSADAFAASVSKGVAMRKPRFGEALRIGAIFGGIEAITPLIGWCIGLFASRFMETVDHWVAFIILAAIGAKMMWEGFSKDEGADEEPQDPSKKMYLLVMTAIATSIDSMAIGVTLALVETNIILMALMIGGATFLMVTIGIMTGHYIGLRAGKVAEVLAGLTLMVIGAKILFDHTNGFVF